MGQTSCIDAASRSDLLVTMSFKLTCKQKQSSLVVPDMGESVYCSCRTYLVNHFLHAVWGCIHSESGRTSYDVLIQPAHHTALLLSARRPHRLRVGHFSAINNPPSCLLRLSLLLCSSAALSLLRADACKDFLKMMVCVEAGQQSSRSHRGCLGCRQRGSCRSTLPCLLRCEACSPLAAWIGACRMWQLPCNCTCMQGGQMAR